MKKITIAIILMIGLIWTISIWGAWDNVKPADSDDWDLAAGYIRNNWDALETVFGIDLTKAHPRYDYNTPTTKANGITALDVNDNGSIWIDANSTRRGQMYFYINGVGNGWIPFNKKFNVQAFGAKGDGTTNDTTAVEAAIGAADDVNGIVFFPPGTYRMNIIITTLKPITIEGSGHSTILKSYTSDGDCIILDTGDSSQGPAKRFAYFTVNGNTGTARAADGINLSTYLSGNNTFYNIYFIECDKAFQKTGSITNTFFNCVFKSNNYAYHASSATGQMHAGCDRVYAAKIFDSKYAAIYINGGGDGGMGSKFQDCIIENNPGFSICILNAVDDEYGDPIIFDNIWLEGNATNAAGVNQIDSENAHVLYLSGCGNTIFQNMLFRADGSTESYEIKNSIFKTFNCSYLGDLATTDWNVSGTSSIHHENLSVRAPSGGTHLNAMSRNVRFWAASDRGFSFRQPIRCVRTTQYTNLWPHGSLSDANGFSPCENLGSLTYHFISGQGLFGDKQVFDVNFTASKIYTTGSIGFENSSAFSVGAGYRIWSFAVKGLNATGKLRYRLYPNAGGTAFMSQGEIDYVSNKWIQYAGIEYESSDITGATAYLAFWNQEATTPSVYFSNCQLVEFSTLEEALDFLNSILFADCTTM